MSRVLVGGIVGGIVAFGWGAASHMFLGIHDQDFRQVENESKLVDAVRDSVKEPGIYYFPWMDPADHGDEAKEKAFTEKYRAGPNGILVRGRDGEDPMSPRELALEFASSVVAALIASIVVAAVGSRCGGVSKVLLVALLGVFAWTSQNASYMIWYRFPKSIEVPELIDAAAEWFLAGIAIAAIVRPKPST